MSTIVTRDVMGRFSARIPAPEERPTPIVFVPTQSACTRCGGLFPKEKGGSLCDKCATGWTTCPHHAEPYPKWRSQCPQCRDHWSASLCRHNEAFAFKFGGRQFTSDISFPHPLMHLDIATKPLEIDNAYLFDTIVSTVARTASEHYIFSCLLTASFISFARSSTDLSERFLKETEKKNFSLKNAVAIVVKFLDNGFKEYIDDKYPGQYSFIPMLNSNAMSIAVQKIKKEVESKQAPLKWDGILHRQWNKHPALAINGGSCWWSNGDYSISRCIAKNNGMLIFTDNYSLYRILLLPVQRRESPRDLRGLLFEWMPAYDHNTGAYGKVEALVLLNAYFYNQERTGALYPDDKTLKSAMSSHLRCGVNPANFADALADSLTGVKAIHDVATGICRSSRNYCYINTGCSFIVPASCGDSISNGNILGGGGCKGNRYGDYCNSAEDPVTGERIGPESEEEDEDYDDEPDYDEDED